MRRNHYFVFVFVALLALLFVMAGCAAPAAPTAAPAAPTAAPAQPTAEAAITEVTRAADGSYPGLWNLQPNGRIETAPFANKKGYTLGVLNVGKQFPVVAAMDKGMEQAATDMNLKILYGDGQGDAQKQIAQFEDFLAQKPDGIVLVALDANAVIPQVEAAAKQGVPVLTCWNDLGGAPVANLPPSVALITFDEIENGRRIAREVLKLLPNGGKVAIIEGAAGFQASVDRSTGFKEVLAQNPKIEIVASQPGNWTRDAALAVAENVLQAHPDLNVIYAHDDSMALGAVDALRNAKLLDKVKVFGLGAQAQAVDAIKKGELFGTLDYAPREQMYGCMKAMVMSLEGVKLPSEMWFPAPPVTATNADQFQYDW